MVKQIEIKNFTVFEDVKIKFSKNLNIISGENGAGKSHLLKLIYSAIMASSEATKKKKNNKKEFPIFLKDKLINVFRADSLGHLAKRRQGMEKCSVKLAFADNGLNFSFFFTNQGGNAVTFEKLPEKFIDNPPIFIPTREVLSIYPNFVSVYENSQIEYEETYRDICLQLGLPLSRGPKSTKVKQLLDVIEDIMDGSLIEENGRFYLNLKGLGKLEIYLVAECLRKVGMLARLIANGTISDKNVLFWDEPEANLNPRIIKKIAKLIFTLCSNGIQVFIGTHSLYLLRELDILSMTQRTKKIELQYINLAKSQSTQGLLEMSCGKSLDDICDIAALDEDIRQADRYMQVETKHGN